MTQGNTVFAMSEQKMIFRILRFLLKAPAKPEMSGDGKKRLLSSELGGAIACDQEIFGRLKYAGLISVDISRVVLTAAGRVMLQDLKAGSAVEQNRQSQCEAELRAVDDAMSVVMINHAESPLALLYRKNKQTGQRFLSDEEFQAGERLRADFTRGNMLPPITANWEAGVAKRFRGERGGAADLSDHALDCRDRVEKALKAVGPELSGVLLDICCFLKGIELVERERAWPVRSGKMMLKTGLSILYRHYTAGRKPERSTASPVYHWGSADYRPVL
ncbi:MAG: DUF6456 domain-containing protein [Brucellaceae bacterium]|jgi:hypothetical protein|nr:DUF6456 domain-containing protein [Brucellaceae bacterium]